jgi:C1A family cysteine protease
LQTASSSKPILQTVIVSATSTKNIDWALLGYTSPVRNQGQCGSCWAFGAVGSVESAFKFKNKTLAYDFS